MKELSEKLHSLLDLGKLEPARNLVYGRIKDFEKSNEGKVCFDLINLYGFLIDIGGDSSNETDIKNGIDFYIKNEDKIKEIITVNSYYYNLANGKHELNKIFYSRNRGVHSINVCRERFQEPIDLYWLAYKNTNEDDPLFSQILVNLSNSLRYNSRIVEAIQMLDIVLKKSPNFPQALISRANCLYDISRVTNYQGTAELHKEIYLSYSNGIATGNLPPHIYNDSLQYMNTAKNIIQKRGFSLNKLINADSEKEYHQHSNYRKFCIDNFLTLNEHSVYCKCKASSKDELQIGIPNVIFKGPILPKLELLLNRIKSEFSHARSSFYKSFSEDTIDNDIIYSELFEGEIINPQSELLRSSFRICYGILDKIALGVCKLYNLEKGGNIYFERFWNDKKRQNKLEEMKNIHLNALSSIANDLNSSRGELKFFKNWRNKLEHNLLILTDKNIPSADTFNILKDENFVVVVDIIEFRNKTLHLLQLTRAAIYSYVYCIRLETITKSDPANTPSLSINVKR